MATILVVNYAPSDAQSKTPIEERHASAARISALDGFRWKYWIKGEDGTRGGVYLFDTPAHARAWGEQVKVRLAAGGGTGVTVRYFEVDPELSALTNGVLAEPVPA